MKTLLCLVVLTAAGFVVPLSVDAQDAETDSPTSETIRETAGEIVSETSEKVEEIAKQVDQNERAHKVSAGILQPIYLLAERMAFPWFHWVAFTCMTAGVISFAFQLVFGKLAVLSRMSFNLKEILADALGLVISLTGLVLTTQAAAQNSTFTESPAAVLSATGVGVVVGLIFYRWGQAEEVQAALGRKTQAKSKG